MGVAHPDPAREVAEHRVLVAEARELAHLPVGLLAAVAGDEVVEADLVDAIAAGGADAGVDPADPALPPLEALLHGPGVGEPAGLADPGGGDVATVADHVDESRLGEEHGERTRFGDDVAALLDQPGPGLLGREGPEQVEEELPAGRLGLATLAAAQEGVRGRIEAALGDVAVEAAEAEAGGLEVPPPVVAEPVSEEVGAGPARENVGEPAGIGVESRLVGDLAELAVGAEDLRDDVGPGSAGPADEEQGRGVPQVGSGCAAGHSLGVESGRHGAWKVARVVGGPLRGPPNPCGKVSGPIARPKACRALSGYLMPSRT